MKRAVVVLDLPRHLEGFSTPFDVCDWLNKVLAQSFIKARPAQTQDAHVFDAPVVGVYMQPCSFTEDGTPVPAHHNDADAWCVFLKTENGGAAMVAAHSDQNKAADTCTAETLRWRVPLLKPPPY